MTAIPARSPGMLWRNRRSRRLILEALFGLGLLAVAAYLVDRVLGLELGFDFLTGTAGFPIGSQWLFDYSSNDTRWFAFLIGIWNTVRVVAVGIVLATLLGVVAGVARLSDNWLVSRLATLYVEIIRNTPLVIQIIFWYSAVLLQLPQIADPVELGGLLFFTNRGVVIPWAEGSSLAWVWAALLAASLVAAWFVRHWRIGIEDRTGNPGRGNRYALLTFLGLGLLAFVVTGLPLSPSTPEVVSSGTGIARFEGGLVITPEFTALLLGLTVYTGAFIAEIVRGSIQALPRGQTEAAKAIGLNGYDRTSLIILPQALRTIIPPLTNQYLNLLKNSSLAIFIAYAELFFVGRTINNEIGRAVPIFVMILVTYQVLSLVISAGMNTLNSRVQTVGR